MADIKIIVDSSDVVTADNRMEQLGKSGSVAEKGVGKAARGMNQFGAVSAMGGKKLNTFNMQVQQGGYQLQDFVVQLQGGTSVFTAFGQQGSQFAGVFGPQGAVIGAVIAIGSAIGGIGYKALTAASQVKEFEEQLKDASSVMDDYISLASKADSVFASLFESSRAALSQTSQASKDLLLIAKTDALDSIRGLGKSLADGSTEAGFWSKTMLNTDKVVTGNLLNIDTALRGNITTWKDTGKEIQSFIDNVRNIGKADSIDGMYQSALNARDIFKETVDVTGEMTEKQKTFWKELSTTILNLEVMGATVEATNGKWSDTKEAIDASTASMKLFYEYAERDASAQEKRRQAVEAIENSLKGSISSDSRRVELAQAGANLDEVKAKHAREDFIIRKKSEGILGNNLVTALKSYDTAQAYLRVEGNRLSSLRQRAAEEKSLAESNARYEKKAAIDAAVAAKKAKELLDLTASISASTPYEPMSAVAVEAAKSQAEMIRVFNATTSLKEELGEAAVEALRIAGVDLAKPVSAASKEAATLAARLGIALSTAIALKKLEDGPKSNVGRGYELLSQELSLRQATGQGFAKDPKKDKPVGGGGKDPRKQLAEYLSGKQQELELETKLVGIFGEERDLQTELLNTQSKYAKVITASQSEELENILRLTQAEKQRQAALEESKSRQDSLAKSISSSMGDAFKSIVDGTMSVKDAFKSMASSIIKQLFEIFVVKKITGFLEAAISGIGGGGGIGSVRPPVRPSANGNVFSGGSQVQAYANGGIVNSPTNFPMSGNQVGLMGEAGPEAIMPLKRGSNGKLGVQMEGGGNSGDNIVVNQNFNFQSNGDDSIKKLIAQAAPQISAMTKSSLLNDRRRGGATKAAFG